MTVGNSGKNLASKPPSPTEWQDAFPNVDEGLNAKEARALLQALRAAAGFFHSCCDLYDVVDNVSAMDADEFNYKFGIELNDGEDPLEVLKSAITAPTCSPDSKRPKLDESILTEDGN